MVKRKVRTKANAKPRSWAERLRPLLEHVSKWMSGLNRFVACGGCKRVLDTSGEDGLFEESTLGWTIELDGRGWLCPKCQKADEKR